MSSTLSIPILDRLLDSAPATAKSIETSPVYLLRLEADGLVRRRGVVHTGQRGRPAVLWALTDKARKRVKRARARS